MKSALFRAILLAGIAHVAFLMPSKDNSAIVTSLISGDTAAYSRRNQLSLGGRIIGGSNDKTHETVVYSGSSSVVQDWSMVCKQLCRAGLGGEPCSSYCKNNESPSEQLKNAITILNPNNALICTDLCKLSLGKDNCQCSNNSKPKNTLDVYERNEVCNTFCMHNIVTLAGCSECKLASDTTTPDWDKLCVILCKTGDGGALCRCGHWGK